MPSDICIAPTTCDRTGANGIGIRRPSMTLDGLALFFHILGAFGLMAALAVEDVVLRGLRGARTGEQARSWLSAMRAVRLVAPASIALILVMGLYLMLAAWGWRGWIVSGLVALLLVGLIG